MIIIKECGEPLIDIKKFCPDLMLRLDPKRMKKEKTIYLRKSVAEMVCRARSYLPHKMSFIIRDGWRPKYVQAEIFQWFINRFKKKYPNWPEKKIIQEVKNYVAPSEGSYVSGHMTGAAVDLRLLKNGKRVPMRSSKLNYQENACSLQLKLPLYIQKNREIMFKALKKAGLSNYPKEYWHWSYGDVQWAKRNKKKIAIYGPIYK